MGNGYRQFCPVALASEVFAERWTPIVMRELLAGSRHFNDIHRGVPRMSRALLASRLRQLEAAGVIASLPADKGQRGEYQLTEAGEEFRAVVGALARWGRRWTRPVDRRNLDAGFLMWNVRRRIALDRLPPRRVLVQFHFTGVIAPRSPRKFWMVLERAGADLCLRHPGFEVDLCVEADLAAMTKVWLGLVSFADAIRAKDIRISGQPLLARQVPSWLLLSPFAAI